jgi:hypothetical protein
MIWERSGLETSLLSHPPFGQFLLLLAVGLPAFKKNDLIVRRSFTPLLYHTESPYPIIANTSDVPASISEGKRTEARQANHISTAPSQDFLTLDIATAPQNDRQRTVADKNMPTSTPS